MQSPPVENLLSGPVALRPECDQNRLDGYWNAGSWAALPELLIQHLGGEPGNLPSKFPADAGYVDAVVLRTTDR